MATEGEYTKRGTDRERDSERKTSTMATEGEYTKRGTDRERDSERKLQPGTRGRIDKERD